MFAWLWVYADRTIQFLKKSDLVNEQSTKHDKGLDRGFSSVGRASALQAECQEFESPKLHQYIVI